MRQLSPILFSLLFFISCTKEIDFEQAKNLEITPIAEISLAFINAEANQFLISGNEITGTISDFIDIDIFKETLINDNLTRVDLVFETENNLPRNFEFSIGFIDESLSEFETFSFQTTEASPHIITFEGEDLEMLKTTSRLSYSIEIITGEGTPITSDTVGGVSLKSKGVFYFNIGG